VRQEINEKSTENASIDSKASKGAIAFSSWCLVVLPPCLIAFALFIAIGKKILSVSFLGFCGFEWLMYLTCFTFLFTVVSVKSPVEILRKSAVPSPFLSQFTVREHMSVSRKVVLVFFCVFGGMLINLPLHLGKTIPISFLQGFEHIIYLLIGGIGFCLFTFLMNWSVFNMNVAEKILIASRGFVWGVMYYGLLMSQGFDVYISLPMCITGSLVCSVVSTGCFQILVLKLQINKQNYDVLKCKFYSTVFQFVLCFGPALTFFVYFLHNFHLINFAFSWKFSVITAIILCLVSSVYAYYWAKKGMAKLKLGAI